MFVIRGNGCLDPPSGLVTSGSLLRASARPSVWNGLRPFGCRVRVYFEGQGVLVSRLGLIPLITYLPSPLDPPSRV